MSSSGVRNVVAVVAAAGNVVLGGFGAQMSTPIKCPRP